MDEEYEISLDEYVDYDDLIQGTRDLEVPFTGRRIAFTYNPNKYDGLLQAKMERASNLPMGDPRRSELFNTLLLTVLTSWNFRRKNEQGEAVMVPIDITALSKLALPLKISMGVAIQTDLGLTAGPKEGSSSDSPTPLPAETAASSRNGIEPVELLGATA